MGSNNPSVLVTGAGGFYGRHLVPSLREQGWQPIAVTHGEESFGADISTFRIDDIGGQIDWLRYMDGVDAVVHLAGLAHPTSFISDDEFDRVNWRATSCIAEAARHTGTKLIYISSVAAQAGSKANHVIFENAPYAPTTAYGRSKARAEQAVVEAGGRYVIFRPVLTYGTGVRGNMGRLIRLAAARVPPPFGGLHNRRSLLAVENACDAIAFALNNDTALGQIFLLADPEPLSVAEIMRTLREGAGMRGGGVHVPPALLSFALRTLGRTDMWDKIGGELVVSVEKLKQIGFHWKVDTRSGLLALGASQAPMQHEVDAPRATSSDAKGVSINDSVNSSSRL